MSEASDPSIARDICQAVGSATGLQRIREASISGPFDDVTVITVKFISTDEQMRAIALHLAENVGRPANPAEKKPEVPPNRLVRMGLHGGDIG